MPTPSGHWKLASTGRLIIHGEPDRFWLVAIEGRDFILSLLDYVHGVVAPFAIARPADIKLIGDWGEEIRMTEVGKILGVGNIHAFFLAEPPDVRRCVRSLMVGHQIELATAVIDRIDVVIRHPLAAQVEGGAFDPTGNDLGATLVDRVGERLTFVILWESRGNLDRITRPKLGTGDNAESHRLAEDEKEDFHDEQLKDGTILIKSKRRQHPEPLLEQRQNLLELFRARFVEEFEDGGLDRGDDSAAIAQALDGYGVIHFVTRADGIGGDVNEIILHQVDGGLLDAHVRFDAAEYDALPPQVFHRTQEFLGTAARERHFLQRGDTGRRLGDFRTDGAKALDVLRCDQRRQF